MDQTLALPQEQRLRLYLQPKLLVFRNQRRQPPPYPLSPLQQINLTMEALPMATRLLQEIPQLMRLILRNEMLLLEEKVRHGHSHLRDPEAEQREDSAAALVQVATVQAVREVFNQKKMTKSLHPGVSLVFAR
jgi:hypothetical protein